jgi:hypothetical protein
MSKQIIYEFLEAMCIDCHPTDANEDEKQLVLLITRY